MKPPRCLAVALAVCFSFGWACAGWAQEKSKDEALDDLLKKLEAGSAAPAPKEEKAKAPEAKEKKASPKPKEEAKPKGKEESQPEAKDGAKKSGSAPKELGSKDQALDDLLEKLGETRDNPTPEKRPAGPGAMPQPPPGPKAEKPSEDQLKGKEKDLDEHLAELLGRKKKKPEQDNAAEGGGPLSDIIKEMRDVEQRLSKPDTGDETRKKQEKIVKNIQELIEQLRASGGQGQGRIRVVRQGRQRAGQQQGGPGAQGNNARGVGPQKPAKPPTKSILAGGKDEWGHLPPELRAEVQNAFKEEPLPDRIDLIRRYYLSLSKNAKSREE